MKTTPILFNSEMVRAILEGKKTQTRRVVKPQPPRMNMMIGKILAATDSVRIGKFHWMDKASKLDEIECFSCPYGKVGDLLWIRETFYETPLGIYYRATEEKPNDGNRKPSMHMPKWASRITLEITDISAEKLQDISVEDAIAEGVNHPLAGHEMASYIVAHADYVADERTEFARLWQSIHGKESWQENPWVWVIEFKPHFVNVDELIKQREAA